MSRYAQRRADPACNVNTLADRIARDAAHRLFVNGLGEQGDRLVMVAEARGRKANSTRDLGGWCQNAVRDQIREAAHAAIYDVIRQWLHL